MERLQVVVASDKARVTDRPEVKTAIESGVAFRVPLVSRVKIARIKAEIVRQNPNIVFTMAALKHPEESNELCGFIRKLRSKVPKTIVIIQTPELTDPQRQQFFEAGANAWVDKAMRRELLNQALERIVAGEAIFETSIITNPVIRRII